VKSSILTVAEAAAELGISPQRVRAMIGDGRLKARRRGLRVYLTERKDAVPSRERQRFAAAARQSGKGRCSCAMNCFLH
jgi:excisionase family DNA binding protein